MFAICRDCAHLFEPGSPLAPPAAPGVCPGCGSPRLLAHPELLDLDIAHVDCDAFYASVEKRDRPELADRPVVVGHPGGRGVVTTACYVARRYGLRSAMPMFRALELCPHAVVIPPAMAKYKQASGEIRALFTRATELVEPLSLDEAYLDLSPAARRIDRPAVLLLVRLALAIERRVGVTVSVGLSYNKALAKLASDRDKPRGFFVIGRKEAKSFLAPLPISALHGIGPATARRMAAMGLNRIDELQALPAADLIARFGKLGRALAHLVQGEDPRRVTPDRPVKSVSAETTFERDQSDLPALGRTLADLAEKVQSRLERSNLAGATVVLKLKTSDFRTLTRQARLSHPTQRAALILEQAHRLLAREADGRAFRLIGVGVSEVTPADAADPPDLFTL